MTEATLLLLTSGSLFLPFCLAQILPPSHEDECGADDWLRLSSGHWMPRIGLGTAGLTEPDLVARVVADALDVGYRLIDTAVRPIGSSWDQIWPLWTAQKLFSQLGSV